MMSIDNAKMVLKPFFLTPSQPKYIRQIASASELSYERVQHYLKELEKISALESKTKGKIKEYAINEKHELVLKIFSLLEMDRRREFYSQNPKLAVWLQNFKEELVQTAAKEAAKTTITDIKFMILFGSSARGEAKAGSDIDVLLVVKNKDAIFDGYIRNIGKKMNALTGKEFSLHVVELREFREKWKKEPFYATLWLDHIVIYNDEAFWKEVLELGEPI